MRHLLLVLVLLVASCASVHAQPAPLVGSTLRTTDTSASSVRVGCTQAGSCTGGVVAGPVDVASVTSAGFIGIANNVPSVTTMRLYNNAGTLTWNGVALATGSSLSGTLNKIPVFTGSNSVGDSIMTQSGATITVATTLNATTLGGTLSTASQPNVTTMAGLVSVGTITTGTWSGTIIGLAKGGTGADLSGTGGTSQFLKQNTVGGVVTVVRPAIADLSDASNVALLNAVNTFTAFGTHTWSAGGAGGNEFRIRNTTAGTTNYAGILLGNDASPAGAVITLQSSTYSTSGFNMQDGLTIGNTRAGGISLVATAGVLGFYAGGSTQRWGINADGDWTIGAGPLIVDSAGVPTMAGFGSGATIVGNDYAFVLHTGTANGGGVVTFGHAFSNAPVCIALDTVTAIVPLMTMTPVNVTLSWSSASPELRVLCRGY